MIYRPCVEPLIPLSVASHGFPVVYVTTTSIFERLVMSLATKQQTCACEYVCARVCMCVCMCATMLVEAYTTQH